jgi:hypothetical protein
MAKDEPQSYGSQADWVSGKTGQEVNRQKGNPNSQHGDFYESRRDGEESAPHQGGHVSDVQMSENAQPETAPSAQHEPTSKVTDQKAGAKRGGFFRDRDYK